jgi:3-oxoacyl-[acyl-carrier-protein] synthase II
VVLGTAFGCFLTNAAYARRIAEGGPGAASPRLFAATVSNAAAGELAIAYRLGGPLVTLTAGSAAGLVALGHAVDQLRAGRAEALVAGGADALGEELDEWMSSAGLDRSRSRSEAAAFVVLETAEGARRRGARIHASIEGYGLGFETPRAQPGADGLAAAIASALEEAGVAAGEVELCVLSSPVPAALDLGSRAARVALEDAFGATFAAGGPLGLLAALAEARRDATVLVVDACASGHVAALVARAGDAA